MNIISWIGTVASIAGAFILALGFNLWGYSFFMVGSISWLIVGIIRRDYALFILNGFFFVANIIGFVRAI